MHNPYSGIPTDHELAQGICDSDTRAFDALVVRYYQPLVNMVIRYVGSPDAAEDVLQDVFTRLWEKRSIWEIPDSVKAYLYVASRNAALDSLRRSQTRSRLEESGGAEELGNKHVTNPAEELEFKEFAEALEHAVSELPERGREVYILSYRQGLSYREIAEILGVSVSTVKTHIARAIISLEQKLTRFLAIF